jgi:glycogen(starch) synthase
MKLLFYSHFFVPSVGGVETIVLSLARGLAEMRTSSGEVPIEVTLLTQTPADNFSDSSLPLRIIRQPANAQLCRLIRTSDVIHVAGAALLPILFGLLFRKPVVVEHHGFQAICPNGQLFIDPPGAPCPGHFMAGHHAACLRCNKARGWFASCKLWLLTFLRRFLCARVAVNITPTVWLGNLLHLPHVQPVLHGLEILPPRPQSSATSSVPPVIAFQGRLVTTKGVRLLFEAARILRGQNRSFELLIIGDGPERATLEQLATEWQLSPHIRFAGRLPAGEIEAALARATIAAVPSLGGEVFGLVVAEDMLRGLPLVASDLGSFGEVLGDAGLTFRTADPTDLAAKLAQLLDDPALAAALGQRARKRVLDFLDRGRMIEDHARIYRGVLAASNK